MTDEWRSADGETFDEATTRATRATAAQGSGLWWLSFAGEDGFRGVVLTHAGSMVEAIHKSHMLGLNPGGEVRGYEVPQQYVGLIKPEEIDRCISDKQEATAIAAREPEQPAAPPKAAG